MSILTLILKLKANQKKKMHRIFALRKKLFEKNLDDEKSYLPNCYYLNQ